VLGAAPMAGEASARFAAEAPAAFRRNFAACGARRVRRPRGAARRARRAARPVGREQQVGGGEGGGRAALGGGEVADARVQQAHLHEHEQRHHQRHAQRDPLGARRLLLARAAADASTVKPAGC